MPGARRIPTREEFEAFRSTVFTTAAEICKNTPASRNQAYKLIDEIIKEMEAEGLPKISSKPRMVPTARVLKKLGLTDREI